MFYDYLLETYGENEPIFVSEIRYEEMSLNSIRQQIKKLTDSDKAAAFGWSKYFSDVKTEVEEIDALAEKGIALGFGDGTYKPGAVITEAHFNLLVERAKVTGLTYEKGMTRAEAAVAIYNKLG